MKEQMKEKDYRDLGFRLEIARLIVLSAHVEISRTHPLSSKVARLAEAAQTGIEKLKCELDNEVCQRAQELAITEPTRVFYGGNKSRIATVYTLLDELTNAVGLNE